MIRELGIDVGRYAEFDDAELYPSLGLERGIFFDEETFGADRLVVGQDGLELREFLARTPLSEPARQDLARLYRGPGGLSARSIAGGEDGALRRMSYLRVPHRSRRGRRRSRALLPDLAAGILGHRQRRAARRRSPGITGFPGFQGMGFPDTGANPSVFPE